MNTVETGKRIKKEREKLGLTQIELGFELGQMSKQSAQTRISKLERGYLSPNTTELIYMSELFHVSTDYLLALTDYKKNKSELTIGDIFKDLFEMEKIGISLKLEQTTEIVPHYYTGDPVSETFENILLSFNQIAMNEKMKEWKQIRDICKTKEEPIYEVMYESWKKDVLSDTTALWIDLDETSTDELPFN